MSETRTLTLTIQVPADQVPENATGRLLWESARAGTPVIGEFSEPCVLTEDSKQMELVIETREPWRVPEHLRHERYNGWIILINDDGHIVTRPRDANGWIVAYRDRSLAEAGRTMGLRSSDFDGMEPGVVYQLGEGHEQ